MSLPGMSQPEQLREIENRINQSSDPNMRKQLELEYAQMKFAVEKLNASAATNMVREAELASQLETENARLREINESLSALERAIDGRVP